ncbi:hypothetical protein Ancab_020321 [Ancistrocladus abbreviatus]
MNRTRVYSKAVTRRAYNENKDYWTSHWSREIHSYRRPKDGDPGSLMIMGMAVVNVHTPFRQSIEAVAARAQVPCKRNRSYTRRNVNGPLSHNKPQGEGRSTSSNNNF